MVSFFDIVDGTIVYDAYSTPIRRSRVMLCVYYQDCLVLPVLVLSVSLEGMGCEPVLNIAVTSDEAVSMICTVIDKTIPSTFGRS